MFCPKCGKELSETARFCSNCGISVRVAKPSDNRLPPDEETTRADASVPAVTADTADYAAETRSSAFAIQVTAPKVVSPDVQTAAPGAAPAASAGTAPAVSAGTALAASALTASTQDLVIRKKRIIVTGGRLIVDGTYYRKTGRRLEKKKGQLGVPLSLVKGVTVNRTSYAGRIIASFLLFLIFTAGAVISGYFGWQAWQRKDVPDRQERLKELEETLEQLSGISQDRLEELDVQLGEAAGKHSLLEVQLEDYQIRRQREILQTALLDSSFDIRALFSTDFFADAYRQYLADLLEAFLSDGQIHDWLYPYYAYSVELGQNKYIQDEMYFYAPPGADSFFSGETQSPAVLLENAYNYDLYQHIYYTGRIYITASDFMNRVLHIPDYAANGAVFLKAYGGTPDPENMYVPGWNNADYAAFWRDAPAYLDSPDPFWRSYRLSAEKFDLDWESLADEQLYYDAYLKFMNTVAPGLGVFDMVSYCAGDDSYGGMYYDIIGKEASVTEIVTLYIEEHPEYMAEQEPDLDKLPSSYDQQLETTRKELEELTAQINVLTGQRNELSALLDSENSLRAEYDRLKKEDQDYRSLLNRNLIIFGSIFILLFIMDLICLVVFIRLARKPKHLMILALEDGTEAAFSIRFCSKKKIAALQEILPTPPAGPHT